MIDMKKKREFESLVTEGAMLETLDRVCAIGTLKKTKGFQRVRVQRKYLVSALELFEKYRPSSKDGEDTVVLFIKTNQIMQIGSEEIGVVISPMVGEFDKKEGKKYV